MNHVSIIIRITGDQDEYVATASTARGKLVAQSKFPSPLRRWKDVQSSLQELGLRSRGEIIDPADHSSTIRKFGEDLFVSLISGEIRPLYDKKNQEPTPR